MQEEIIKYAWTLIVPLIPLGIWIVNKLIDINKKHEEGRTKLHSRVDEVSEKANSTHEELQIFKAVNAEREKNRKHSSDKI